MKYHIRDPNLSFFIASAITQNFVVTLGEIVDNEHGVYLIFELFNKKEPKKERIQIRKLTPLIHSDAYENK